jgi:hypothetical protein
VADSGAAADSGAPADSGTAADSGAVVPNDDPFDPVSCGGAVLSAADALAVLGASARAKLADATLMRRTRACTGATPETCGPWNAPVPHTQALLTYSGGVTTDYKTFSFPTHLVLYKANATTPKLSVRHASDYQHDATASARGIGFAFGASPMVNTYPVIYVWDFAPAPYRYEDLQGLIGSRAELDARERCARFVSTSGVHTEIAALYRY